MLLGRDIVLREYTSSDAEGILEWRNDPDTTRWMGRRFRYPATREEVFASLEKVIAGTQKDAAFFAIADKETLDYRGGIDLTSIDATDRNAVLSIVLAAGCRGKGYAGQAVTLLLGHAFRERGLHKVSLNVYERNEAALRCYLRAGFQIEGRTRDHAFLEGRYHDLLAMGMLASEFRARRS